MKKEEIIARAILATPSAIIFLPFHILDMPMGYMDAPYGGCLFCIWVAYLKAIFKKGNNIDPLKNTPNQVGQLKDLAKKLKIPIYKI